MCGIAGVYLRNPDFDVNLDKLLDCLLEQIEHRGGDATGYVAIGDDGVLEWQKAACGAFDFSTYRRDVPRGSRVILAHTRFATQGLPAFMENNHPLRRGSFFVIHNGHVNNDSAMMKACGKPRSGQVDSEAIVASLARAGSLEALARVVEDIDGMAAVAAVDERRPDRLTLARGFASPLYVLETTNVVIFGSTARTVLTAYRQCIGTIADDRVQEIAEGTVLHYTGLERREEKFTAYAPPVRKWTPTKPAVKATVTDGATGQTWDEDYLDCDDCGVWVPWTQIFYREDERLGFTVAQCADCARWEDEREDDGDFSFLRTRSDALTTDEADDDEPMCRVPARVITSQTTRIPY